MGKAIEANNKILEICGNNAKHENQLVSFINGRKEAKRQRIENNLKHKKMDRMNEEAKILNWK